MNDKGEFDGRSKIPAFIRYQREIKHLEAERDRLKSDWAKNRTQNLINEIKEALAQELEKQSAK